MNAQQRKFLIEKINKETKQKIEELKSKKIDYPNANNYLFKAILSDTLKLKSEQHILSVLKARAMDSKDGKDWLTNEHSGWASRVDVVKIGIVDLIDLPEDFRNKIEEVRLHNNEIQKEIDLLQVQLNSIEMRVQLASDKVLQKLINEVDDMGELSLVNTTLKSLD
jgi:hypothetical protein